MTGCRGRRRFDVAGVVQGVGFRPFVYVTAAGLGADRVGRATTPRGVVVEVEGDADAVAEFGRAAARRTRRRWPSSSDVRSTGAARRAAAPASRSRRPPRRAAARTLAVAGRRDLRRLPARAGRPGRPAVPAPVHHLHQLRSAVHDHHRPAVRPAGHHDGRLRDVRGVRAREYADPADRRFHAQPIACHDCGPRLELVRPGAPAAHRRRRAAPPPGALLAAGRDRGRQGARRLPPRLRRRATTRAVAELRRRKRRGDKPFAVMVARPRRRPRAGRRSTDAEAALLTGPRRPIVLLARRAGAGALADGGRARQPRPRRAAAVHAAARAAVRAAGRPARPGRRW